MTAHDFLTITDLSEAKLRGLFRAAGRLKRRWTIGRRALAGKIVALVFQKPSMRTRVAFEVAVLQLGGSVISLGQENIQLGQREPVKDVARVLSRYVDAIVVRTFAHRTAQEFAAYASVPVINGLSDLVHPCQALADLFTMQEQFGRLRGVRLAYVGDGNNVLHSLLEGCAMCGVNVVVATPRRYRPDASIWKAATRRAKAHGASIRWEADPRAAVRGGFTTVCTMANTEPVVDTPTLVEFLRSEGAKVGLINLIVAVQIAAHGFKQFITEAAVKLLSFFNPVGDPSKRHD